MKMDNLNELTKNEQDIPEETVTPQDSTTEQEESGVLVLEGEEGFFDDENNGGEAEQEPYHIYTPRFTEASERYRLKGDARVRERFGIKQRPEKPEGNPDEIDPTAEFDADINGVEDAKTPENVALDESDESISVLKFKTPEEELEEEARREREEIKKLLGSDVKAAPAPEKDEEESAEDEEIPEETTEEENIETEPEEYTLPDPDEDELKVYEFEPVSNKTEPDLPPSETNKKNNREFNNPIQRDSIKDRFLDLLISIRIRRVASLVFALGILILEILAAAGAVKFNLFGGNASYSTLGIVDLLLGTCLFVIAMPEIVRAVKSLIEKKITRELLSVPMYALFLAYTLVASFSGQKKYALFGILFASVIIPILTAALYRSKADFIAFKMIAQPEDKQVIDLVNTRELDVENKALDGVVDEYRSKLSRTFNASFISDFFKNSDGGEISLKHAGLIYGIPFGAALICGIVAYFLSWSFVTAMAVFALGAMLGCPIFSIIAGKISFFHSQRAALLTDSTAIGEDSYHDFAGVDVFAFDDTDLFGPDDVNLKRFMLYGDRENMEQVMRQMCALFAAVGGPLDYMFSGIIDNRVRHKTATNLIIEDDGILGEVAGHKICAGSEDYMRRNGIAIPQAASGRETGSSLDTIKIMYAAEDGEVNAKFYIRYSFSEEFASTIPSLRDAQIIPLVYTRDPNISGELLSTLTAGIGTMRVVKLYDPIPEDTTASRVDARMITYGDRLDAASMIILSKKYHKFSLYLKFAELCAAIIGVILAISLSLIGLQRFTVIFAALWHVVTCTAIRLLSKAVFLRENKRANAE